MEPGVKRVPVRPGSTRSGKGTWSGAATAQRRAMASAIVRPKDSPREVEITAPPDSRTASRKTGMRP